MSDLFGTGQNDIGISYIRLTMGCSDLQAVEPYTYDDVPNGQTDFDLHHFTIDKDRALVIPVLKEALTINPNLKIMASPWTAPAWMKTFHKFNGGDFINDARYMQTYANYFVKFIEAYKAEGINIDSLSVQNEPLLAKDDYPTMVMNVDVMKIFIRDHLGPLFRQRHIATKILIWDFNWDGSWYPEAIISDNNAKQYVSGVAWHGYYGRHEAPEHFHDKHPDIVFGILVCCLFVDSFLLNNNDEYQVWLTTGDKTRLLSRQQPCPVTSQHHGYSVWVDRNKRRQTIHGFGASLTNSAAWVIYHSPIKSQIIRDLFGTGIDDLGVSYLRLTMGGSDLQAVETYTYDDVPNGQTDYNLDHFSIDKDRQFFIPVIKEALAVNPNLKLLGTPWSAPAWMKESHTLNGGQFKSDTRVYQTYAMYFVKFIEAYKAEGIPIEALAVQNEPLYDTNGYPTMKMTAEQQTVFIRDHLGPLFRQRNIHTKILIFDHNWSDAWYPEQVVSDANAKQYVSGVAWHGYSGLHYTPDTFHNKHPDLEMYFTEISGGDWDTNFASTLDFDMRNIFIGQTRNWATTVLLWSIALDQNHGPKANNVQGCMNCRGVITVPTNSNQYTKNVEYYTMGHMSRFIKPGAVRLDSNYISWDELRTAAFVNTDGTTVIVVHNPSSSDKSFSLDIDAKHYQYNNLPPHSVVTFVK